MELGRPYRIGQSGNRVPAPGGGGRACEREAISERTKAAPCGGQGAGDASRDPGPGRRSKMQFAANILPLIREVQAGGHTSLNAIAGQLNARKVATARVGGRMFRWGKSWSARRSDRTIAPPLPALLVAVRSVIPPDNR
jgi:hypothetical protein